MSKQEFLNLLEEQERVNGELQKALLEAGEYGSIAIASPSPSHSQNEIMRLSIKQAEIAEKILNAEIVENTVEDIIEFGSIVKIALNGKPMTIRMVGEAQISDDGIPQVSVASPLGQAIYGKELGTEVSYKMGSQTFIAQIIEVQNELSLGGNTVFGR